jgi:hypothetical protein
MPSPSDDESKELAALTPKWGVTLTCRDLEPEPTSGWSRPEPLPAL